MCDHGSITTCSRMPRSDRQINSLGAKKIEPPAIDGPADFSKTCAHRDRCAETRWLLPDLQNPRRLSPPSPLKPTTACSR